SARAAVFVPAALIANTALLACLPGIFLVLLALLVRGSRVLGIAQAFLWTAFLVLVYADTRIWRLFRYHFNGMVWNVITTPGAEDAVELGPKAWATSIGWGAVLCAA